MKICDERLKPFSVLRFTVQVFLSAIECAECPEYTGTAFCQVSFWYEPIETSYPADDKEQEKSILQSLQSSWYNAGSGCSE